MHAVFGRYFREQTCKLLGIAAPASSEAQLTEPTPSLRQPNVEAVLAPRSALVRRIRVVYGHPDDQFDGHLLAPITSLASWLHLLPGHPGGGFERSGGAIEQALTNCLFSLQAADGRTFDRPEAEASSTDATQCWRLACGLGGLFVSLRETLTRIEVASDDGALWPAAAMPLMTWLESRQVAKYHYHWTSTRSDFPWSSIYVASRCIDPAVMSFLTRGDARIPAAMMRSVAGLDWSVRDPISDVVDRIAVAVAARGQPQAAVRPADLIAPTLKRLLSTSDWLPNSPGGHVWFGADGLYLLWPDAGIKLLVSMPRALRGTAGFESHRDLLRHMASSGLICTSPSSLFHIRPPGIAKPQSAVRVTDPHRIFEELGLRAAPLELQLGVPAPRAGASEDTADRVGALELVNGRGNVAGVPNVNRDLFTEEQHADSLEGPKALDDELPFPEPDPQLELDTSKIVNLRSRALVDDVVSRLEQSFDTMLSKIVTTGVFVALTEFAGQHGDGASIVRALHDAGLIAVDKSTPSRRVHTEKIEGVDVEGIVLPAEAFHGYAKWVCRWQDGAGDEARLESLGESLGQSGL
jgi:conjugal transfer pilus assembly protein TraI